MEVAVGTGMELVGARAGLVVEVEVAVGARKIILTKQKRKE